MTTDNNHTPIVIPPPPLPLQYILLSAVTAVFDYIVTILLSNLQQQRGATTQIMRGSSSLASIPSPRRGSTGLVSWETTRIMRGSSSLESQPNPQPNPRGSTRNPCRGSELNPRGSTRIPCRGLDQQILNPTQGIEVQNHSKIIPKVGKKEKK